MRIQNILHISYFSPTYPGNFIASLARLTEATQKEYAVYFLFPIQARGAEWLSMLPVAQDRIFFCDFSPKGLYNYCKTLAATLGAHKTVAHTHFIDFLHLYAIKRSFKNNVCHYHMAAPEANTWKRKIRRALCRMIYAKSVIIGVSEPVAKGVHAYLPNAPCECITNAIDFEQLDTYSMGAPHKVGDTSDAFNLLIFGSDFHRKGVDLAIQAVELLNTSHRKHCSLTILAHPIQVAQEHVKRYSTEGKSITVVDTVRNIKDFFDGADAFLSPSRSEAFAYAVAEAAYCQCQVIASDVPGQNTLMDIPMVLWVTPNDVQSLADAICATIDRKNNGELERINALQKEYVRAHYGIELWVKKNIDIYKKYFDAKKETPT